MEKNIKQSLHFLLKSKIVDQIDREEILQCYICNEKYDKKVRIPMISCLQCIDIVCLKCLNDKCQSYKAKGMFNKCNKCPKQMIPAQFKRCLPILKFIEIYQKIKAKQTYYRQSYQKLQIRLLQFQSLQSSQSIKNIKLQLQKVNISYENLLKQNQDLTNQLVWVKKCNSQKLEQIKTLNEKNQKFYQNWRVTSIRQKYITTQYLTIKKNMKELKEQKTKLEEQKTKLEDQLKIQKQKVEKLTNNLNRLLKEKQVSDKKKQLQFEAFKGKDHNSQLKIRDLQDKLKIPHSVSSQVDIRKKQYFYKQ